MSDIGYQAILPEGWERPRGFSHAVVAGGTRVVKIAGQIGRAPTSGGWRATISAPSGGSRWRTWSRCCAPRVANRSTL